MIIILPYKAP
jgi:hypothetical protein